MISASTSEVLEALADDAAFEAWYRRTVGPVFSYLMSRSGGEREIAEDITQQTYIAAIEQRWRFAGRADATTWLIGIARHKLADHYRAAERAERRLIRVDVQQIDVHEREGFAVDDVEAIAMAFRTLPPSQRAILAFVAQDGLSVAQAGRLLGKSESAAESLLHRARAGFRRAYGEESADA